MVSDSTANEERIRIVSDYPKRVFSKDVADLVARYASVATWAWTLLVVVFVAGFLLAVASPSSAEMARSAAVVWTTYVVRAVVVALLIFGAAWEVAFFVSPSYERVFYILWNVSVVNGPVVLATIDRRLVLFIDRAHVRAGYETSLLRDGVALMGEGGYLHRTLAGYVMGRVALWAVYPAFAALLVPTQLLLNDRQWLIGAFVLTLSAIFLSRPSRSRLARMVMTAAISEAIADTFAGKDRSLDRGFVDLLDAMLVPRDEAAGA
jgi:hypothetical protein